MQESYIFSLDGRDDLIGKITDKAKNWDLPVKTLIGEANKQKFSDGELCVDFDDSVRGKRVFLLSSPNTSDEIMKLMLAIDAARRGGCKDIIPILPYFPYARQDKKDQSRGPIGAKVMANMLVVNGATGLITFDLHADQIQGFFDIPITHIEGKNVFDSEINFIMESNPDESFVLCGPDAGSGKRVKRMQKELLKKHDKSINYVMMDKTRSKANTIDEMVIIGDVTGKNVIIIDDMVDTAGTLCKAADVLLEAGAKSVRAVISHGVLSGPAYKRILNSNLKELIISDSLLTKEFLDEQKDSEYIKTRTDGKIKTISLSTQIAMAMASIDNHMSYEAIKSLRNDL